MAILKKTSGKKTVGKVKSLLKKSHTKNVGPMKTLRISRSAQPFMTTRVTRQTAYWSILLAFILVMQLWILKIQLDVIQITDSIGTLG